MVINNHKDNQRNDRKKENCFCSFFNQIKEAAPWNMYMPTLAAEIRRNRKSRIRINFAWS